MLFCMAQVKRNQVRTSMVIGHHLCSITLLECCFKVYFFAIQNQPALEKDRYKIRQAFVAAEGNSLIVADYGQVSSCLLVMIVSSS